MDVMQGFPPREEARATLANWRTQPYSSWAFHHVREIVPSAEVAHDPARVRALPAGDPLIADHEIEAGLNQMQTDAFVVLHQGRIAHERYRNGMQAEDPHILMSVSKSVLGLLAGCLSERGLIDPSAQLTDYLPELATTAYAGATLRQALDMRVGVAFDEDYETADGLIIAYRKAANWNPLEPGDTASDLRGFQLGLTQGDGPHGGRFHYVSPVTDMLAWLFERATGVRYADLLSRYLWQPIGAERPAYITIDRIGGARAAGGFCVTARDLARLGAVMAQSGARDNAQVIPRGWLEDIAAGGDRAAWADGDFADRVPGVPISYRSKWYVHDDGGPLIHGMGIHGQFLFVDPSRDLSIAWMASEDAPTEDDRFDKVMDLVGKLRAAC